MVLRMRQSPGRIASQAIAGAGVVDAASSLIGWWMFSPLFGPVEWAFTCSFSIFLVLGIVARKAPLTASTISAGIFTALCKFEVMWWPQMSFLRLAILVVEGTLIIVAVIVSIRSYVLRSAANVEASAEDIR